MAKEIVIASACRTAIGKFGGTLKDVPAVELGATVIKEAVNRAGLKPEQIDEVIMGGVIMGGLGQNPARQASIKAGLPVECTAMTINIVCGSGLKAVALAANQIKAEEAEIVVCGGMENMSAAPYAVPSARWGAPCPSPALPSSRRPRRCAADRRPTNTGCRPRPRVR